MNKICKIDGCNNKHFGLGYCQRHYKKYRKYGNPLYGKTLRLKENHNMSNTPELHTWSAMIQRCINPKINNYHRYGGRGIKVCDRWLNSFVNFYTDMGKKPFPEAQIDRINNDGNYEPSNCRWVTQKENSQNRVTTKLTPDIVKEIRSSLGYDTLKLAIKYNVSRSAIQRAISYKTWKNVINHGRK